MKFAHTTIVVAGSHSTGKSTFLDGVEARLVSKGIRVGRVADTATKAHEIGFPILRDHVYESTLWIMAEGLRQEMEAALRSEVILVDRPLIDAVGYLRAALEATGRKIDDARMQELLQMAVGHQARYDWFATTVLDETVPLGDGRDRDSDFRRLAGSTIADLTKAYVPNARWLEIANTAVLTEEVVDLALKRNRS